MREKASENGWAARWRVALAALALLILAAAALAPHGGAQAFGWLTKITKLGSSSGKVGSAGKLAGGAVGVEGAARYVANLPVKPGAPHALAASAGAEGHWRLVNRAGETFTAASAEEVRRGLSILVPQGAAKDGARIALYIPEESAFVARAAFKDLPATAELHLVGSTGKALKLVRRSEGSGSVHLAAEVRPALLLTLTEQAAFREALWQLERPLNRASIRQLALEPGGPAALTTTPRFDKASRALTDTIDPTHLARALDSIRGQTALLTGRVEAGVLHFKAASGREGSIVLADLMKSASAADVNLVVLRTASPRQPGSRNWLWLKVETSGLDEALKRATFGDFLNALAAEHGRMAITATAEAGLRVRLTAAPVRAADGAPLGPVGSFDEVITALTGHLPVQTIELALRAYERDEELDRRLIPGIPADVQLTYFGLILVGLIFGLAMARRWWARIWPPEQRAEYAGRVGYEAARAVRFLAFLLVFLPVVALPAMLVSGLILLGTGAKWLTSRISRAKAPLKQERST